MFTDKSYLLLDNPGQLNYGAAVTDIDGDGAFEVFVAGFGFPNLILKWTGAGFENIADDTLADAARQAIGVAAGDINSDGREELYILNSDTFAGAKRFGDRLFLNRGLKWVDLFGIEDNAAALNMTAGRSVVALDRDGDGVYGFFVANYGGPMRLYELSTSGLIEDVARQAGLNLAAGGRGLLALPLVTPYMDVFAGNEQGPNFLFVSSGMGTFKEAAEPYGLSDPAQHVRGVAALDADGDGRFDLVYGNWEGPHRLFLRRGDTFVDKTPPEMAAPSRVRTVIAADFDNDGVEEIFFNNIGQPNRLFARRGDRWVPVDMGDALEESGLGTGAVVGDFDGDGRLELLITHGESGLQPLTYYHAPENDHHWLRVLPLTRHGAPARGAVVRIKHYDGREQIRAIDAGSGYLCQMEPVAHFGLGATESVARVEIRWLDGTEITFNRPVVDHLLRVPYPTA
jgi:hypothetical protein